VSRKSKTVRPPVPTPKVLKVVPGSLTNALTWKDFEIQLRSLRSRYQAIADRDDQNQEAAFMVGLCNAVLLCPSDDFASSIAVRAAFSLGGVVMQDLNRERWEANGIGRELAVAIARKEGSETLDRLNAQKSLSCNADWLAVKQIYDRNPGMKARDIQKQLARPLDKTKVQRWVRDLKSLKKG